MTRCWVCGCDDTVIWKAADVQRPLQPDDLRITDARFGTTLPLRRCRRCAFVFADGPVDVVPLYEQLADPAYIETGDTRALQMAWLLDHLFEHRPQPATLLDIGAGTGLLVAEALRRGIDAIGVEPSRRLAAHARSRGVPILEGTLPHPALQGRTFDVVALVDVIEHVTAPVALLRDAAERVSPEGILVLVTPNLASVPARLMGRRWWHFRLAHIGYFSPRSLAVAAERAGCRVEETFSARWFFRLRYIAERASRYAPVGAVNRAADRLTLLRRLYERTISFNLHDSMGAILRRQGDGAAITGDKRLPQGRLPGVAHD